MQTDFSRRVRMHRKAAGLTQQELADKIGVSAPAVRSWEAGTARPRLDKLGELAKALDTTSAELLGESTASDLSWDELELIEEYRLLPVEYRFRVLGEVDDLVKRLDER